MRSPLIFLFFCLLSAFVNPFAASAEGPEPAHPRRITVVVPDYKDSSGRVYQLERSGSITQEFRGFVDPVYVLADESAGVFRVLDQGTNRIYTVSLEGNLLNTVRLPPRFPQPIRFEPLESGRYLVAAGDQGVYEVSPDGEVVWSGAPPAVGALISGAVRLTGGRTVVTVRMPDRSPSMLFLYRPGSSVPQPLAFAPSNPLRNVNGMTRDREGSEDHVVVWDNDWGEVYVVAIGADDAALIKRQIQILRPLEAKIEGEHITSVHEDLSVALRDVNGAAEHRIGALYQPLSASFLEGRGTVLIAVRTVPNAVFNQTLPVGAPWNPLDWGVVWGWLLGSAFVAGITVFALASKSAERWSGVVHGGILAASLALGLMQIYLGDDPRCHSYRVGMWGASLIILGALAVNPHKLLPSSSQLKEVMADLALPVIVGAWTLCCQLHEIPRYYHFDFTYYILHGYAVIAGTASSIWQYGFVPAPLIGLFPHILAMKLFGFAPITFRIGAVAIGFVGIAAVYGFGRFWAGRLVGVLGAVLLAGNVSYIHLSRLPTAGESAVAALLVLWSFAVAMRSASIRPWLVCGILSGYSWYLWPVARVGTISIFITFVILGVLSPIKTLREWHKPALLALAFFVFVSPLAPLWIHNPVMMFPRVQESMKVYDFNASHVAWTDIARSFGGPLWDSVLWFFSRYDNSSQGTLSPAFSVFEQGLFLLGLGALWCARNRTTLLFLVHIGVTLVVCGAWADSPPWATRLLPIIPVATLIMALPLQQMIQRIPAIPRRYVAGGVFVVVLVFSPAWNFRRYSEYEWNRSGGRLGEMSAIGYALREIPSDVPGYLVVTNRSDWSLASGGRFGELLPFIFGRKMEEVRELGSVLPIPEGGRGVFVLQAARSEADFKSIRRVHPTARLQELRDPQGGHLGSLVHVGEKE